MPVDLSIGAQIDPQYCLVCMAQAALTIWRGGRSLRFLDHLVACMAPTWSLVNIRVERQRAS
jgi:hypothetical protein